MATLPSVTRTATVLALLLAVAQLFWAGVRANGTGVGIATALGVTTLVAGVIHAQLSSFESRLAVGVACGAQVALMALAVVLGLPGQPRHPLDPSALVALVLPTVVIALLVADQWQARRHRDDVRPSSYAL